MNKYSRFLKWLFEPIFEDIKYKQDRYIRLDKDEETLIKVYKDLQDKESILE